MALETVVNIADLVKTNPTGADPKSQGDDHLRNIKTALLNDFAGFTGAVLVTGVDGGTADAYTLTPTNALVAYTSKMLIEFTPAATNLTTTPTLNISGLGAKTIKSVANAALVAGDLVISVPTLAVYDGTSVRLIGPTKNYIDQLAFSAALPAGALGFLRNDGAGASAFTQTHTGYAQKEVKGADIVCAATIDLTAATGNYVHITGATGPITAITIAVGAEYTLVIDSTPSLTRSATLETPNQQNIVFTAGDVIKVRGETGGARIVSHVAGSATTAQVKAGTAANLTISPAALYAALGFASYFQSANQTITAGGGLTIAHGLARVPVLTHCILKCTTTDLGYAVGDEAVVSPDNDINSGAGEFGFSVFSDATNIGVRYTGGVFQLPNKGTGVIGTINNSNWRLVVRVWA